MMIVGWSDIVDFADSEKPKKGVQLRGTKKIIRLKYNDLKRLFSSLNRNRTCI